MKYRAQIKSREDIERDIPRNLQGWWADVCPGDVLTVRDATQNDLDRCILNDGRSRDPADYVCEAIERGAIVPRFAIQNLSPLGEEAK